MITKRDGKRILRIFDAFNIDRDLPKYKGKKGEDNRGNPVFTIQTNTNTGTNEILLTDNTTPAQNWGTPSNEGGWSVDSVEVNRFNIFKKLKINIRSKRIEAKKRERALISIRNYFTNFAQGFKELTPIAEIGDHYEKAILQATSLGQTSLVERLKDMVGVVRGEAHLIQMDLKYYVTNGQVCDFYESSDQDKHLKLTWIKNFVKIIPNDVVEIKDEVDKRGIFDNYVILHYDPNDDATDLTKVEKEIKKDPILFGVINNSLKLYYIADWKDDYCDLTLEGMFEELGEKTLEINNKNLKTYINKVGDYEQKRKKIKSKSK
jgi:hypothetical protein